MNWPQIILCAALYAFGVLSHWWYQSGIEDAVDDAIGRVAQVTAAQIGGIESTQTVIHNKVVKEVRTEKVYTECVHAPDTLLLVNKALTNGR